MKKLFYFPSFSAGPISMMMKKDHYTPNQKLSFRYYSEKYPESYRVPAYLTTAGHCYKTENYIEPFNFESDVEIFGDSGGFQIAMGRLEYTDQLRDKIFYWLENNSTVAANLDIPPKATNVGNFDECLDISNKNFKYFCEKQSGKIRFLNVLQGLTLERYQKWYDVVKGYDFNGWAIGVAQAQASLYQVMASLVVLMDGKEHFNKNNKYIHFLGVTGIDELVYLTQIQKSLNELGCDIQISTDSSSPNLQAKFGGYWRPANIGWTNLHIARDISLKGGKIDYDKFPNWPIPFNPISQILFDEYKDSNLLKEYKSEAYAAIVLNNLSVMTDSIKLIEHTIYSDPYIQEQLLKPYVFQQINLIDKIIKSDNPLKEFIKNVSSLTKERPNIPIRLTDSDFF